MVDPAPRTLPDPELQPYLARDALIGLDHLLTGQSHGESIRCHHVGAIIRLIVQAAPPLR